MQIDSQKSMALFAKNYPPRSSVSQTYSEEILEPSEGLYFDAEKLNCTLPGNVLFMKDTFDLNGITLLDR